jgi:hypothetical protein
MFEFTVAFGFTIAGYLLLERRYPIRSIGFVPFGVALALLLYASSLPNEVKPLVPAPERAAPAIHVGMATTIARDLRDGFAAGLGYLIQGQGDRFGWLPSQGARRGRLSGGDHRLPDLRDVIILGSWWASIAWSYTRAGIEGDRSARDLARLCGLPPRPQPALVGRPTGALLLVVGFGMVLVTYSGNLWFNGLHAYSGL